MLLEIKKNVSCIIRIDPEIPKKKKKTYEKINTYHAQESFSVKKDFTPLKST